jgi:hypothetical protein
MTTRNSKVLLRVLLAMAVTAGLLWNQWPLASHGSAAATLNLKSESQLKTEAGLYDTAIREISRLADLKLANPDTSKTALSIIDKQAPNLKFGRSKLIALGLGNSTFVSAVKAKGADKKSTEQFGQELSKDPNSILKLNGASAVADQIRNSAAADIAKLQKVAQLLRQAGADIKAKAHHAVKARSTATVSEAALTLPPAGLTTEQIVILVVVVAVIAFPPLGIVLVDISSPAVAGVIAAALVAEAALLVARLVENAGTDKGRDRVAECEDNAAARKRHCISEAGDLPFPISIAAEDACYAQWLLDAAVCLVA